MGPCITGLTTFRRMDVSQERGTRSYECREASIIQAPEGHCPDEGRYRSVRLPPSLLGWSVRRVRAHPRCTPNPLNFWGVRGALPRNEARKGAQRRSKMMHRSIEWVRQGAVREVGSPSGRPVGHLRDLRPDRLRVPGLRGRFEPAVESIVAQPGWRRTPGEAPSPSREFGVASSGPTGWVDDVVSERHPTLGRTPGLRLPS